MPASREIASKMLAMGCTLKFSVTGWRSASARRGRSGARGVLVLQFLAQRFRLPIARLFQNALDPLLGLARSLLPHGGGFVQLRLQPQTALQLTLQLPRAHMIRHQRQQAAHFLQRGRVVAGLHLALAACSVSSANTVLLPTTLLRRSTSPGCWRSAVSATRNCSSALAGGLSRTSFDWPATRILPASS